MSTVGTTGAETHQEQLARLSAEVQALRAQLKQAQRLATVGTMTAMVAHEFNNILTPIINYARLAQKNPALVTKAVNHAADGGQRATDICKALLGTLRGEAGKSAEINVSELLAGTLTAMAREPKKDGIELVCDVPADLQMLTRRVELQQVLLNLIMNARSAVTARSGLRRIEISARRSGQGVAFRVADNGVGIPPEHLEKIFEPFFTTKAASAQDGHGLGLAVCREIVTSLGGDISVESSLGIGTTFTVRLPG
jgi:signal transduction histidine kinase